MFIATLAHDLLLDGQVVYLCNEGSNVPHSVLIDGEIIELIDPPTISITAGKTPLPITEDDLS